jgi:hypothetical protein
MSFVPQTSSYTAQQVITEVRRTLGDLGGVLFSDDDALTWLNAGQRDIAKDLALFGEADVALVAGQRDYVIPVEISKRIRDIQTILVDERRLEPISYVQAQQRWMRPGGPALPADGEPKWWFARNQTVSLVPAPDASALVDAPLMQVQFSRQPVDIATSTETIDIPDTHYNALVAYVRYRAYLVTQEAELAQSSLTEMQTLVQSERQREKRTQTNTFFALEPDEELY